MIRHAYTYYVDDMRNLTLAIEDDLLKAARRYAAEHDTTVNAMIRSYLRQVTLRENRLKQAKEELRKLSESSAARLGPDYRWNRDEIYEERLFPGHKRSDLRGGGGQG